MAALMIFFMTEIEHLCLPNAGAKYNRKRSRNYREYASSRMQVVRRSESSAFHRGLFVQLYLRTYHKWRPDAFDPPQQAAE